MLQSLSMTKQSGVRALPSSVATTGVAADDCAGFAFMALVDPAALAG